MEDLETDMKQKNNAGTLVVAYRGADAKIEAERLYNRLQTSGLSAEPPSEVEQGDVRLGAAEIIITIVLTGTAKAVVITALKYLEDYLRECAEKGGADLNIQVVLKDPAAPRAKRLPFSLRQATIETVRAFSESIRQAVTKL